MNNYRIKVVMILSILMNNFIVIHAMFNDAGVRRTFTDTEKSVVKHCEYETVLTLGFTSSINHEKVHNFLAQVHQGYLICLEKKISRAQSLEKKVKILRDELLLIQERYLQKKDALYRILKNKNPNIEILKKTAGFVTRKIIKKELIKPLKAYRNQRYTIVFWSFLSIIKRHQYIAEEDKKDIYNQIDPIIKTLKIPFSNGKTIRESFKPKHESCTIF